MFLTEFFGHFSLSAFTMWAFMMAFLFNVFVYSIGNKRNTTLLLSSLIMFISYSSYEYFLDWLSIYELTYLDLAIYDGCTIAALFIAKYFIKTSSSSLLYLIFGLSTNLSLALCMQLDTFILRNSEPWFFWDFYTFSVITIDLLMAVSLIVDRDFLGLHKLKSKLCGLFKSTKPQPTT